MSRQGLELKIETCYRGNHKGLGHYIIKTHKSDVIVICKINMGALNVVWLNIWF